MDVRTGRDLALALKAARLSRGLTQQDVADAVGVSRQWVVNVEAQRSNPGLLTVLTALSVVGLSMTIAPAESVSPAQVLPVDDLDALLERHTSFDDD